MVLSVLRWPSAGAGAGNQRLDGGSAGSVLRSQGSSGEDGVFALCARVGVDRFQCLLQPGPAAAGLLGGLSLNGGGLIVGHEEKQSSLSRCVVVMALRALGRWGHEGGGGSGKGEAFGVPQRGTAYQPGVKPRVWHTTGAF